MCMLLAMTFMAQISVDAGPAKAVCGGQAVTLEGSIQNPPTNYSLDWDGMAGYELLVASPTVDTLYTFTLTDLDTMLTYSDTTWVLVHPSDPDLNGDFNYDLTDWRLLWANWQTTNPPLDMDPDGDGQVTILDWFYFCNFVQNPPNTPPMLQTVQPETTVTSETVTIAYDLSDLEQTPVLQIASPPDNGFASIIAGVLRYTSDPGFEGTDTFEIRGFDGTYHSQVQTVQVDVIAPENWTDLYNDIFFVRCKACHIDAAEGGLSLNTYAQAQAGGNSGPGFIPGMPSGSWIYIRVANESMPALPPPLSFEDKERIRVWILRGAPE